MKRRHNFIELLIVFVAIFSVVLWNNAHFVASSPTVESFFPEALPLQAKEPVRMLFAGDIMLGRHVGKLIALHGPHYPFEKIAADIEALSPDFFVANLEGPITLRNAPDDRVSPEQPFPMRFFFDPSVAETLKNVGFTHLSLANNHIFDQGREGARDTLAHLESVGIDVLGFRDGSQLGNVSRVQRNEYNIVFVGLDTTIFTHDTEALREEFSKFPPETFVVTFLHWGEEYEKIHSPKQESFAHSLIDRGVDLVLGSHPHVVQDIETYKDKKIYYSLGNFVFDQYWNNDVQTGLMLLVTLDGDAISYEEIPIKSQHSQPYRENASTTRSN